MSGFEAAARQELESIFADDLDLLSGFTETARYCLKAHEASLVTISVVDIRGLVRRCAAASPEQTLIEDATLVGVQFVQLRRSESEGFTQISCYAETANPREQLAMNVLVGLEADDLLPFESAILG